MDFKAKVRAHRRGYYLMLIFVVLCGMCVSFSAALLLQTSSNEHYIYNFNITQNNNKPSVSPTISTDINKSDKCIDRSKYKINLLKSFGVHNNTHSKTDEYVLVLGSGGLIGSHLKEKLSQKGYKVLHIQNRHHRDLRIPGSLDIFNDFNIKFVYFLAYEVGGAKYLQQDSIQDRILTSNNQMMDNVFNYLIEHKLKFAFASSSLSADNSSYGIVKLKGEKITQDHPELGRLFRLWNAYGFEFPGPRSHAIPDFVFQCVTTGRLKTLTDGEEVRQFTHVNDIVSALIAIMENFEEVPLTVDISDGKWISLRSVAEEVARSVPGCSLELPNKKAKKQIRHEPNLTTVFHNKFWKQQLSLEEGIAEVGDKLQKYVNSAKSHSAATFIIRAEEWDENVHKDAEFVSERIESIAKELSPMKVSIILSVSDKVCQDISTKLNLVKGSLNDALAKVDTNVTVITNTHTIPSYDHFILIQHGSVHPLFLYHANVSMYENREDAVKSIPKPDLAYFELCNECKNYSDTTVARSISYIMASTDTFREIGAPPPNVSIHDWMMQLQSGYHSIQHEENVVGWGQENIIEPNGKSCCYGKIENY